MIDAKMEKQIVTGMVVSTEFLQGISQIYTDQLQIPMLRRVAGWCIDYYKQYEQAPKAYIEDVFKKEKKKLRKEEAFLIEELLKRLSKKYANKEFNIEYVLNSGEEYFRTVAIQKLKDGITNSLEKGKLTRAENLVKKFERTARPISKGVDPFSHEEVIEAFSEENSDVMFGFPGTLGEVIGLFEREYLVSIFGTRGKGKTWWLLWISLLAVFKGYNVVFVSLEMSKKQLVRRVHQFLSGLPLRGGLVKIPKFNFGEGKNLTYFKEVQKGKLSTHLAIDKLNVMDESSLIKAHLKMLFFPSGRKTMEDLRSQLANMENYDDFIPSVIVTDYADKFKSEIKGDRRHQLDEVWNGHKALAQERKCLVVTASQANTARTGKDVGEGTATETMAKEDLSDVTLALNQKPDEKRQGVMRVGVTKHRHDDYDIAREVYVTQCHKIGRPYLDSVLKPLKGNEKK